MENLSNEIILALDSCGIPRRYNGLMLSSFNPINLKAAKCLDICCQFVDGWSDHFEAGDGMLFCGLPGTGKTHLACAVVREVIVKYQASAYITTAQRIIRAYRDTWRSDSERSEYDVIGFYSTQDLLVIDEIGVQYGSSSERQTLFEIINNRYESQLPSVVISNYPDDELSEFLGDRAVERIVQSGAVLAFDWDNQRGKP